MTSPPDVWALLERLIAVIDGPKLNDEKYSFKAVEAARAALAQRDRFEAAEARVKELEEACAMKDRIIRNLHPEASGLRARLETLETRLEATRNGYGYLQDRLASVGYSGWAHDMDSEINSTY